MPVHRGYFPAKDGTRGTAVTMPDPWSTEAPGNSKTLSFFLRLTFHWGENEDLSQEAASQVTLRKITPQKSFSFFWFFGGKPHQRHMEVPRPGVRSRLQWPAYCTATVTQDPSRVWDLRHSSRQGQILNPWARPGIEPATSWFLVRFLSTVPQQEHQRSCLKGK